MDAEITMMDLRVVYESLPAELSDLILEKERTGLFWRKSIDSSIPHITMLCDQKSIEAATVLVCLWRESLISQQKYLYDAILVAIKLWRKANQSSHIQSITTILIKFNSKLKI